jgi:FecR protein
VEPLIGSSDIIKKILPAAIFCFLITGSIQAVAQTNSPAIPPAVRIAGTQGLVETFTTTSGTWITAPTNLTLHPADHVRTGPNSRVTLRWSDESIVTFGPTTELEIQPPSSAGELPGLQLLHGVISFFHRDRPGRIQILTRGTVAGVEGTEFLLAVDDADATTLSVLDGQVRFSNTNSFLILTNGQQAVSTPGQKATRTAGFIANNLLQWCFYYPAVIAPEDLQLTESGKKNLAASLASYQAGDLTTALENFPSNRTDLSDREKIFHATLLLSVGAVEQVETILDSVTDQSPPTKNLAAALRQLIAAVKRQPFAADHPPKLASEFLAASYFEQARAVRETSLNNAREYARQAVALPHRAGCATTANMVHGIASVTNSP